ncbi:MAG TPA: transcriptional repressor LexA [Gammaproteobacteria bacterium]
MTDLTAIQLKILDFIKASLAERRMPPTVREIAEYMGYRSDNAAYQHLQALQRKGVLELEGRSRGIRLRVPLGLPIVGQVAAGAPILAEEHIAGYLPVTSCLFRKPADFLLRVKGDSMRDAGILDGDLLAVHKTRQVEQNQIVVARLEDEVTVKRYRQRGNVVTLLPENADYEPIKVDLRRESLAIEGVMAGLIRGGEPVGE